MNIFAHVSDPVYLHRPIQILRRMEWAMSQPQETEEAPLAWGGHLRVWPGESIGRNILHRGVHDHSVAEACFRLTSRGGQALDVGAHVGQMTSAVAHAVGSTGKVISIEPHPLVCRRLRENVELIRRETGTTITVRDQAASDSDDSQVLYCPPGWKKNTGVSSLKEQEGGKGIEVQGVRLDSFVDEDIQVVKLDVEGAEADVLRGAQRALAQKRITHVIFEEHAPGSSDAVEILRSEGYSIYALDSHFVGPRLRGPLPERGWPDELYNFVATGQPEELQRVYRKNGWKCLRG